MRVAFSNVLAVFWQVRLKNAHCKKLPNPETLQPDDLDWLKAATMGNQMDNHIYVADWTGIPALTRSIYKKIDRGALPLQIIAPRWGNKEEEYEMMKWCLIRYQKGLTALGWLKLGRNFPNIIDPPLACYKHNIIAMRSAHPPPDAFLSA